MNKCCHALALEVTHEKGNRCTALVEAARFQEYTRDMMSLVGDGDT